MQNVFKFYLYVIILIATLSAQANPMTSLIRKEIAITDSSALLHGKKLCAKSMAYNYISFFSESKINPESIQLTATDNKNELFYFAAKSFNEDPLSFVLRLNFKFNQKDKMLICRVNYTANNSMIEYEREIQTEFLLVKDINSDTFFRSLLIYNLDPCSDSDFSEGINLIGIQNETNTRHGLFHSYHNSCY